MALIDELLARAGKTRADVNLRSRLGGSLSAEGVPDSPEVQRVLGLPRRPPPEPELAADLSELLRLPGSTAELRPLQAEALYTLSEDGMLLGDIEVGAGKTLITALAPLVLGAKRPLLLIPAALRGKTEADFAALRADWPVPEIQILHYETLSRADHADDLFELDPDFIEGDEAHKLLNPGAAVTRRVQRFVSERHPTMALLSGTLRRRQLLSLWHILQWTHGPDKAPIPRTQKETAQWSRAIDGSGDLRTSLAPGALAPFGITQPELQAGYHAHVSRSRGVVAGNGAAIGASLRLVIESPPLHPRAAEAIDLLRRTGTRPDGVELEDAQLVDTEFQESLGFWYGWTKRPPERWLLARRAWFRLVRSVLEQHLDGLDSPEQVMRRFGRTTPEGIEWRAVRGMFAPTREANWMTFDTLAEIVGSCASEPTLIWTDYTAVGEAIEQRYGIPFYREEQRTAGGALLTNAARTTIVLSIKACREGANLQQWNHNLILTPPASEEWWQQMLGRTHRSGQSADEVIARVFAPTERARDRVMAARADARELQNATKKPRKLAYADIV